MFFDNQEIEFPCPACQAQLTKSLKWIKENSVLVCSECNEEISLNKEQFTDKLAEVEGSVDDLMKALKKFR